MTSRVHVPVEVPLLGDERHKNWAKVVEAVDSAKTSGWAYEGSFVATGGVQDLPAGSVLLVYGESGSRSNPRIVARAYIVNADATLTFEAEARGKAWARTLRDPIERRLDSSADTGLDLSPLPDEVLADELRGRGWKVEQP